MRANTDHRAAIPTASLQCAASPRYPGHREMGLPGMLQAVRAPSGTWQWGKEQDTHCKCHGGTYKGASIAGRCCRELTRFRAVTFILVTALAQHPLLRVYKQRATALQNMLVKGHRSAVSVFQMLSLL